ncbi:MAG: DUF5676 family membrane protein [Pseudomonadota bacterium]
MNISTKHLASKPAAATPLLASSVRSIPVFAFGMGLSGFFAISFVLCVLGYLFFPGLPIAHSALSIVLPGFTLLSWSSFLLGFVESLGWGWYVALVFAPLFNFFATR